jgi:RHS repeat-associated protein
LDQTPKDPTWECPRNLDPRQTSKTYDADRNVKTFTDADNNQASYAYDAADQLLNVTRPDTTTLTYGYDGDGNVTSQRDGLQNATTYAYANSALPQNVTAVTDANGRATTYGYDGAGNRTSKQDPGGNCAATPKVGCTSLAYDAANQLTSITYSDGTTPNVSNISYDADGQRTAMIDGTGTSSWSWDSLHRLTSHNNGVGATVGYGYDLKGQLTSIAYPGSTGSVSRSYDDAGRLHTVTDWLAHQTIFDYDADSNLTTQTNPNGTVATSSYDGADRLTAIAHATAAAPGTPFARFTYGRDNADQLTSAVNAGPATDGSSSAYTYTPLNQIKGVNSANYGYDAADNLTQLTNGTTQAFDAANQLCWSAPTGTGSCVSPPPGATLFGYDNRGNRTSVTPGAGQIPPAPPVTLAYDQANRLTAYGATGAYTYTGDGLRASKSVLGVAEPYTWDVAEGRPVLLVDGTTSYVYGPGGLPLEQITSAGTVTYYHHDQLGSTRVLTNPAGIVVGTYAFDPYGKQTASTGSVTNPFGFAGEYTDAESGLLYMRARYYDPATAQWLTRDPLTAITHAPYAYVGDNPLNGTDPLGLCWGPECWLEHFGGSHSKTVCDLLDGGLAAGLAGGDCPRPAPPADCTTRALQAGSLRSGSSAEEARSAGNDSGFGISDQYVAEQARNGKGWTFRPPGSEGNDNIIRVMEPTPRYPDGYVRVYNDYGQPVNLEGKPLGPEETHLPSRQTICRSNSRADV